MGTKGNQAVLNYIMNLVPPRLPDSDSEFCPEESKDNPTEMAQEFRGDDDLFAVLIWKDELYNCLGEG